ncbi:hypothetical protein [Enterobacter ludwigii]|uniref:hypothetical protein n=1 Tax=Enterobacter ludwigii TaxID=299767 RepID=UPI000643A388|nr:hypothetical protein [Enterobacter ludwigii]KLR48518.1 hypothetical protein ABR23_00195 [Enterobacter ludwigii]
MWRVPDWSQAVDSMATAFLTLAGGAKKLSKTYSLNGKRSKSNDLLDKIVKSLAGKNQQLTLLLPIYLDVVQAGLRELRTLHLLPSASDKKCRQAFYEIWVIPFLISLRQQIAFQSEEAVLLRSVVSLLQDYQAVSHLQTADSFLNKRVIALLPHGCCTDVRMQMHNNRNRRVFSFNAEDQHELFVEIGIQLTAGGQNQQEAEYILQQLSLLFRGGAILRTVDKWLGGGKRNSQMGVEQQEKTAQKFTNYAANVIGGSHIFLDLFAQEANLFYQFIGHVEVVTNANNGDPNLMSQEDKNRLWPALFLQAFENKLINCPEDYYLEEVYDFCEEHAPEHLQHHLNREEMECLRIDAEMEYALGAPHEDIQKRHHQIQQMAFLALKKMTVALHNERQLGLYGVSLASSLIAVSLSTTYRIITNELTPLLNVLIDNLPTNDRLFPQYWFITPFNKRELGMPGAPLKKGQDITKDDEALILALACRLHNRRLYRLNGDNKKIFHLGYPFMKLGALLEQLVADGAMVKTLTPQAVDAVFRAHNIRRREGDNGNPCWRLSDATPYDILRNLELHIQLTGVTRQDIIYICKGIDAYYSMSRAEKRRVLKLIDPVAYRSDLKRWWASKQAKFSGKSSYEVEGEYYVIQKFAPS